jgi:hypothetical protein
VTSGGSSDTVGVRVRNVTAGPNATPSINNSTGAVVGSTEDSSGSIDLIGDGSIWRFWIKISASSGDRILIAFPTLSEINTDMRFPAAFYGDLSVSDITNLA